MTRARRWGPCTCGCTVTDLGYLLLRVNLKVDRIEYHQIIDCADVEGWNRNVELLDEGACPVCDGWEDGGGCVVRPDANGVQDTPCGRLIFETPAGLRALDVTGYNEGLWDSIASYDMLNGTRWFLLLSVKDFVEVDTNGLYAAVQPITEKDLEVQ